TKFRPSYSVWSPSGRARRSGRFASRIPTREDSSINGGRKFRRIPAGCLPAEVPPIPRSLGEPKQIFCGTQLHAQMDPWKFLCLSGEKVQKIPQRHQRDEFAMGGYLGEVGRLKREVSEYAADRR